MKILKFSLCFCLLLWGGCQSNDPENPTPNPPSIPNEISNTFSEPIANGAIANSQIQEASGLASSQSFSNALWTHNDSGDEARLFLLGEDGQDLGQIYLPSIENRDWEDMAIVQDPNDGQYYIYLADIGSGNTTGTLYIYRFPEPSASQTPIADTIPAEAIETFQLQFPQSTVDAETLLVDEQGNLFILSKELSQTTIYKASLASLSNSPSTLENVGSLPLALVVGGDYLASNQNQEILLKTYDRVYLWQINNGSGNQSLEELLTQNSPFRLSYTPEPQGEAIAWKTSGQSYFTLSEVGLGGSTPTLFRYDRW